MRRIILFTLLVLLLGIGVAAAHAHLKQSVPGDGSVLRVSPPQLTLTFSESARLTALWIEPEGGARQKVAPLPASRAAEVTVALPPLKPGKYVIAWRVLGDDGHVVPGQLHFTLQE
ncbi:MAG TPA: copper resistance CopC family protein [Steroidobacteraceae bacterium]|nr:copper resistance CopC family protein [Steroidobacteraceae bacterium]